MYKYCHAKEFSITSVSKLSLHKELMRDIIFSACSIGHKIFGNIFF